MTIMRPEANAHPDTLVDLRQGGGQGLLQLLTVAVDTARRARHAHGRDTRGPSRSGWAPKHFSWVDFTGSV